MKKTPTISSLYRVPEQIVQSAWEAVNKDENSGFAVVLRAAEVYKAADMTPVFIFDERSMQIYCYAEETLGKRLH